MEARPLTFADARLWWLLAAAVAAQVALVAAPIGGGGALTHVPAVALLVLGLWALRRGAAVAPLVLLAGLPLVWALAAVGRPHGAPAAVPVALVALAATVAWFVAASRALQPARPRLEVEWTERDSNGGAGASDPMPAVAGLLVGGTLLGVAVWPAIPRAAAVGFPGESGRVTVALATLALLIGLALATDLARGRPRLPGRVSRIRGLAALAALSCLAWALARSWAG